MKIINCEQKSDEWWKQKEKRMSASHAQAIGANGKGLVTYIDEMMQEYYSTGEPKRFSNKHTDRGNELEDSAGFMYQMETGIETQKIGFVIHNDYVGCSPDLFAGEDGGAEIKSRDDKEYFRLLKYGTIKSEDDWQMQMCMLVCEKNWWDFVAYNPNYKKNTWIKRVFPDPVKFKKLEAGFAAGEKMIRETSEIMERILGIAA